MEKLMQGISFRPHHFLCALSFKGNGYSPGFIKNFANIMEHLNSEAGANTPIAVVAHTDSICRPCPHRLGLLCETESKINVLDQAHAKALQINPGMSLSWREAKEIIKNRMTLDTFNDVCSSCSWKALGICEGVLKEFLPATHC
jgi:hypothetical protein